MAAFGSPDDRGGGSRCWCWGAGRRSYGLLKDETARGETGVSDTHLTINCGLNLAAHLQRPQASGPPKGCSDQFCSGKVSNQSGARRPCLKLRRKFSGYKGWYASFRGLGSLEPAKALLSFPISQKRTLDEAASGRASPRSFSCRIGINQRTKEFVRMSPLRMRMLEELQLRNYADFTIERHLAVEHFRSSLRTWGGTGGKGDFTPAIVLLKVCALSEAMRATDWSPSLVPALFPVRSTIASFALNPARATGRV